MTTIFSKHSCKNARVLPSVLWHSLCIYLYLLFIALPIAGKVTPHKSTAAAIYGFIKSIVPIPATILVAIETTLGIMLTELVTTVSISEVKRLRISPE